MISETELLSDLTFAQQAAVMHMEGPLLILAGAGSGKTRVITRRVAWLIAQKVRPTSILAITFTNKAASEMKERIEKLVPGNRVWISTFHSLGARLLRQYADRVNLDKNFTIYDMDDRNKLIKASLEATGIDDVKFSPERLGGAISKAKNALQTPKQFAATANDFFSQTVASVYAIYEKRLRECNAMDFDDLLYIPALALRHNAELRAELDARFQYILIDEYQDTNSAQYEIARRLSTDVTNICVVGDPDQCMPTGILIDTPQGHRPIEDLKAGDYVRSGTGWDKTGWRRIDQVATNPFAGQLVCVTMADGRTVRATPNHRFFASAAETEGQGTSQTRTGIKSKLFRRAEIELSSSVDFQCIRAEYLEVGMVLPVVNEELQTEAMSIIRIDREYYNGLVYDLSVPQTHNFSANEILVHNSIYKWRGSDIRNIMDFERDYPTTTTITLDRNYRSTKAILHVASTLIERNKQRKKKSLITENDDGEPVRVLVFDTGLDEADLVAKRIKADVTGGRYKYREVALFVRMNALTRTLESAFVKHGVPFQIVKGLAFFDRKENRDVLAYLRLLVNPRDTISFLRAVNEPTRGIGKTSLEYLQTYAEEHGVSLMSACQEVHKITSIRGKASTGLKAFGKMMTELHAMVERSPSELISEVLDRSGYRKALKDSGEDEDQERLANIEELVTAAKQFSSDDPSRTIVDFLETITLSSDTDGYNEKSDCVSVMTLHAAKGLEFPVVYMMAVEQGILPHERSLGKEDDVEEERRLAFVGITRAMKELYICTSRMREFRGQELYAVPSMFLEELPDTIERIDLTRNAGRNNVMSRWRGGSAAANASYGDSGLKAGAGTGSATPPTAYAASRASATPEVGPAVTGNDEYFVGQIVEHDSYGIGQIKDVSGFGAMKKIRIRFPVGGEKTFVASMVKLKKVERKT